MREAHTLITADAGYYSDDNVKALHERSIPALMADNGMRQRDERFAEQGKHKAKGEVLYDKRAQRSSRSSSSGPRTSASTTTTRPPARRARR